MTKEFKVKPVGVGLVGCGNFACITHLPNLHQSSLADLRWVCDLDEDRRSKAAAYSRAKGTGRVKDLWDDPAVEAVVIAVRDDQQALLCAEALKAGKKVYLEKPGGGSSEDIDGLLAQEKACGSKVWMGFQKRFSPAYQEAKRLLDQVGGARNLFLRMTDDAWRWAIGYPPGALMRVDVCHFFDLARWFTGAEIASVYAIRSRPDDDSLLLQMTNGVPVSLIFSGHGTMDMPKERMEAINERGGVTVEDYVEVCAFGYPDEAFRSTFPGIIRKDLPVEAADWLKGQGAQGLRKLRRKAWQARQKVSNLAPGESLLEEDARWAKIIPNFLRDQGWRSSLEAFLASVRKPSEDFPAAGLQDAKCAAEAASAARESQESGEIQYLKTVSPAEPFAPLPS
ncbi:MAG: Gfo/Idh/MocA family oxidoreductase [Opitutales bacterium]|nr:Gfo/Idh/MocA family oxidoreductase [Opitutales bacterium]MCH8541679.1 Gfo/Idh/MocA family oxidoreductase [Opitutales bacterium]